ncbi:uncharacterized protein [Watersipora subatra]|uniref:uncharacterized protein isoform X1 n=1 Tax=Watersipora subatra TaxID=2589382 RepID=UPI00355B25D4
MRITLFVVLWVFGVKGGSAASAKIDILNPSPIIEYNNGRKTYEAVRMEEIEFAADFSNAVPMPEEDLRISFIRLLHSEEEPVPNSSLTCDSNPCQLNISVTANEHAESKFTFRGLDKSGDPVVDSSFHVTVGEAKSLEWLCNADCYRHDTGNLLIAPRTTGYPTPHLYQLYSQGDELIANLKVNSVNDQFNLSTTDYRPGEVLTLVVSNRLGNSISMYVETTEAPTSTIAVTTTRNDRVTLTEALSAQDNVAKIVIPLVAVVSIIIIVVALVIVMKKLKSLWKWCSGGATQTTPADSSNDEESRSLRPDDQNIHGPSFQVHCHVTIQPAEQHDSLETSVIPGAHAPPSLSSSRQSTISCDTEVGQSLCHDGAAAEETEHQMEELKAEERDPCHVDHTADSSDLEMDGAYATPVQESQGSHCSLAKDPLSDH